MRIDSHAHVFLRDLPLARHARHAPQHDATAQTFLALLDAHGITHALLTAPSFLGTDNSYLLAALVEARGRLRGTVIVDPDIDGASLDQLARSGVVGIRLNWLRVADLPDVAGPSYRRLFARVRDLDWHVEIYLEGPRLASVLPAIAKSGVKIVVDHFGSPDPVAGVECEGFKQVLASLATGRTWVKLSAPYRLGGGDAAGYAKALLREGGPERLVWGSDWPWTQHAAGLTYAMALEWLEQWVPDGAARGSILAETPAEVFGFEIPRC